MIQAHGTSIALSGAGVLLRGPSGVGKSDLALRLVGEGARLIADDRTGIVREGGRLFAVAPASIAGLLEVRGLGLVEVAHVGRAELRLVIDLVPEAEVERMPEPASAEFLGVFVPRRAFCAHHASTPAKLRLALDLATGRAGLRESA
ncbi:MAG: HPr kinase/phosphorylase [Alphaproteobacteria bacterium]